MSRRPPDSDGPHAGRVAVGAGRESRGEFEIRDLAVAYASDSGHTPVVGGVSVRVRPGLITGLAGESGSGKTTAALSAIAYLPAGARRLGGEVLLDGQSILDLDRVALRRLWASKISYVAQDAGAALNPAGDDG